MGPTEDELLARQALQFHQRSNHFAHYELDRMRMKCNNIQDNEPLRIKYILKEIDREDMKREIMKKDKKRNISVAILQIYELVNTVFTESIRDIYEILRSHNFKVASCIARRAAWKADRKADRKTARLEAMKKALEEKLGRELSVPGTAGAAAAVDLMIELSDSDSDSDDSSEEEKSPDTFETPRQVIERNLKRSHALREYANKELAKISVLYSQTVLYINNDLSTSKRKYKRSDIKA